MKGRIPRTRKWSPVNTGHGQRAGSLQCTGGVFPGNDNGQGAVEPRWGCTGGPSLPSAAKVIHLKATRHK